MRNSRYFRNFIGLYIVSTLLLVGVNTQAQALRKNLNYSQLPKEIAQELERRFPSIKTRKLAPADVDEVIRFIQSRPDIRTVKVIDPGGTQLYRMDFELNRVVKNINIDGNKSINTTDVRNIFAVKSDDIFDQQTLVEGGERLQLAYRDLGFYNPVIDIAMPSLSPESVSVEINIKEGAQTRIKEIQLTSPNTQLNKKLAVEMRRFRNHAYTEAKGIEIQKKIRAYLLENKYIRADASLPIEQFNTSETEASLSFIIDKPEQYSFEFKGVDFLDLRTLKAELNLEEYHSASPNIGSEIAQKIRNYYLINGYARAEIRSQEIESSTFQRKLVFEIDRGPKVKITAFNITGHFSQKQKNYVNFIKSHSSKTVESGYYNKEDLDNGFKNLILQLQNNGNLQARITSSRTQYNAERNAVTVYLNLDEGPLTKITAINFEGNHEIPSNELQKILNLEPGPLLLPQVESAIRNLKTYYHDRGYIEMTLTNERSDLVTYNEENTEAVLNFRITEGPQVHVASILLEGNSFTSNYVIRKELEFTEGDLLTPVRLNESVARLQRTGFFSSVEIQSLEEKTSISHRTMVVKVRERDPGLFTLGAGATNERTLTLRGYTGISYRNLFGTGRGLSLRLEGNYNVADLKYLESRVVLGYLEPYIFDSRIRGRVNVTRSSLVSSYEFKQVSDVRSTTYSLEKDFTSRILGIWDIWSLATIRDYGLDSTYPFETVEQNIATTGPQIDVDFRDNPFIPTRGTFTRFNAEYASPSIGSSPTIEYWRSTLSFTHYLSVGSLKLQPVVWANQVRGGYMKNLSSDGGIPWDKKGFTLGGQSTVRGYEAGTQEVFPNRDDFGLSPTAATYYVTDSSSMMLFKSELRFAVWESLGGALFYDGATVLVDDLKFADPYRDSAGFGIRYNTPVGPLSLEWAWKLDARPGEEPWRFHLSIGTF